jgi:hypothetical protein
LGSRPGIVTFRRQTVAQNEIAPSALAAEERLSFQRTASRKTRGLAPVVSDIRLSEAAFELFWVETLGRVLIRPFKKLTACRKVGGLYGPAPRVSSQKSPEKSGRNEV